MTKVVGRKILIFFLTLTGFLFSSNEIFAATIETPTNVPSEVQISQTFSFNTNITSTQAGEAYFVKCRLGQTSTTLTAGQTYNPITNTWLSDTSSWKDFPTVTVSEDSFSISIQCRTKSNTSIGQKLVYASACLKKSDGSCGSSFKSSAGATTNVITTASSSPTPTPIPSPSSSSSTSPASSSFTISNLPAQINSDQSFSISVNLSLPNNPNTTYYLAGAFKITGGNRYFGLTKSGSEWIKYSSENFSNQYKIATNSSGAWTGNLEIKPDTSDSDYKGSGNYVFKITRYTQAGSQTWSNEADIKIISTEIEEQGGISTSDPPSSTINPSSPPQSNPKKNDSLSQASSKINYNVASIAGITTAAASSAVPQIEVKNQKQINHFFWLGIIFVFAGIGSLGYIYLRRNGTVFNKFRKRN